MGHRARRPRISTGFNGLPLAGIRAILLCPPACPHGRFNTWQVGRFPALGRGPTMRRRTAGSPVGLRHYPLACHELAQHRAPAWSAQTAPPSLSCQQGSAGSNSGARRFSQSATSSGLWPLPKTLIDTLPACFLMPARSQRASGRHVALRRGRESMRTHRCRPMSYSRDGLCCGVGGAGFGCTTLEPTFGGWGVAGAGPLGW